ncbi:HEXXH motif-containing putative peptide modification protein [Leifsonia sp. NPDC077715]|uniref:aKG-HExxH-type peptide beta-hydroxylase n=1 Tax=Leifsonia sp. NPDC077715 TaxID=3155539 RepID=UPI003418C0E4
MSGLQLRLDVTAQAPVVSSREAAIRLGLRSASVASTPAGLLPIAIHNRLIGRERFSSDEFAVSPLVVNGHEFYWLNPPAPDTCAKVGLRGHRIVGDTSGRLETLRAALEIIGMRAQALELVRTFITTFGWVEPADDGSSEPLLTSCSLPDLPLMAFVSDMADRHIPPLTVAAEGSPRLLAENIYHESVHQLVNFRILSEDLFRPDYDSRRSPLVPIAWRRTSIKRNQDWPLDRVLHAASVYSQLLDWRLHELRSDILTGTERAAIEKAAVDSLESATFLSAALCENIDWFTPAGALFVGRLAQSAEQRVRMLSDMLEVELVG